MNLTRVAALVALAVLIVGVGATAVMLNSSTPTLAPTPTAAPTPTPAPTVTPTTTLAPIPTGAATLDPATAQAMQQSSADVLAELLAAINPQRPLVLTLELFRKGGYKTHEDGYIVVYPERVISRTVITPDGNGRVASVTEDISTFDGELPVRDEFIGDIGSPPGNDGIGWDLSEWLEALSRFWSEIEAGGFAYVGKSLVKGQPSVRYEDRSAVSLRVLEFVEANPLLGQESHYTILDDGELVLEFQTTTVSVAAEE